MWKGRMGKIIHTYRYNAGCTQRYDDSFIPVFFKNGHDGFFCVCVRVCQMLAEQNKSF